MPRSVEMIFVSWVLSGAGVCLAGTPWENYVDHPSPQNAKVVKVLSYSKVEAGMSERHGETWEADLGILENQVAAGDVQALRLAFRLLSDADGAMAEALSQIIGRSIRPFPAQFLRELTNFGEISKRFLPNIAGGLGYAYVDRSTSRNYELERRAAAVRRVASPELLAVREECLKVLQRAIREEKAANPTFERDARKSGARPSP